MYDCHKERGSGSEENHIKSPKAKALWKMTAAKDRREDFFDPERKDNILVRNNARLEVWEEHAKRPDRSTGQSLKCVENGY